MQADERIIAHLTGFQRGARDGPFVVLFEQERADEADDDVVVRKDADDLGAPLNLAVEPFDWVGAVELGGAPWGGSCRPARRTRRRPMMAASLGTLGGICSATPRHFVLRLPASPGQTRW
ncbi:hypothetical protein X773_33890 [Mesorhizobium sp. LSJC285A00]|nr:hypothetical protein X773_33890 [Mesorhizobium sp. LSJC285A00]